MQFDPVRWLPLFIPAVASVLLGLFVWKQRRGRVGLIFFILTLLLSVWATTNAVADASASIRTASFWTTLLMVSAAGIPLFLLYFSLEFPVQKNLSPTVILLLALPFLVVSYLLIHTPYIVERAVPMHGYAQIAFGSYSWVYVAVFMLYLLTGLLFLVISSLKSTGRTHSQVSVFFTGVLITSGIATLTNLVLPLFFSIYFFSDYSILAATVFLGFTAYAIIAHHLFDIRLVIRRTVIYSGILLLVLGVYSMAILLAAAMFGDRNVLNWNALVANVLCSFLISLGYPRINHWLRDITDRIFYRKDYVKQGILGDIAHKLNDVLSLDEALEITMQGLVRTFRLRHAATYVFQRGEKNQVVVKRIRQIGYSSLSKLTLEDKDFFTTYFGARENILVISKLRGEVREEITKVRQIEQAKEANAGQARQVLQVKTAVLKKLEDLDVAVALPLRINQRPIGVILLSPTLSDEAFDQSDLDLMDLVSSQVVAAIQKAQLYEGDQAKSEFVSIASHELLTPIAAMEGYLSMVLDDKTGQTKIDAQAKGYLEKVYMSAKRLSDLVSDMLSASRIESGEMKIEPQQLDLGKVIQDALDQLRFTALDKKLTLELEPIPGNLPPVWADKDRTTQVLINLVGNAIKYTPKGSVRVRTVVHHDTKMVEVDVSDTGLGMTKEQQLRLYEKFYRVSSQQTANTQGTGLGLYITKSILERMDGKIWLESEAGRGSTFAFSLPFFAAETSRA